MAVDVKFDYALADFISFRDREECERVRRIRRAELTVHSNSDFRIRVVDDPAAALVAVAGVGWAVFRPKGSGAANADDCGRVSPVVVSVVPAMALVTV
mgnify:CR=1 FL=1